MTPLAAPVPEPSSWPVRIAVGVSIAVHVLAVSLSLGYAGAGLFAAEPEAVPVSLVAPEDLPEPTPPEVTPPEPKPETDFSKLDLRPAQADPPQPAKPQPAQQSQPAGKPQAATQQQAAQQTAKPAPAAQPAYTPPAPDLALQYGVDFGLKPMPQITAAGDAPKDGTSDFDDAATRQADVAKSAVAAFRAHLKACAALPAPLSPDDKVVIVLRAMFTPDAKLAGTPVLIEASASAKGPALMQAAIAALQNCQPYADLPADKYAEWRVLDLRFTPLDFKGS